MGYHSDMYKRREERLSQLKKLGKIQGMKQNNDNYHFEQGTRTNGLLKILGSIVVLIGVYFIFSVQHPAAILSQNFIKEALTREFNFSGIYNMYKEKFIGNPAIIPTFAIKEKKNNNLSFASPILGLPLKIEGVNNGVMIETNANETVLAMDMGIIKKISKRENQGNTLGILHQDGIEVEYTYLGDIFVEVNDWVESGQRVGETKNKVFISIKDNNTFINPLDVIKFD